MYTVNYFLFMVGLKETFGIRILDIFRLSFRPVMEILLENLLQNWENDDKNKLRGGGAFCFHFFAKPVDNLPRYSTPLDLNKNLPTISQNNPLQFK